MSARKRPLDLDAEIMTVREVSKYLRVSVSTVHRLADRHELPAFKVTHDWRFSRKSIEGWMLEKQKTSRTAVYPPRTKR
jgi:excisionase family DNA binding protein